MMSIYTYNKSIAEAINELDKKLKRAKNRMNPTEWDRVSVGLDAVLHNEIGSILDNLNEIYNSYAYEGASTSRDTVEESSTTYDTVGKDICLVPDPTPSISDISEDEESVMEEGAMSYQVKSNSIGLLNDIIMIDTDIYDSLCIVDDTEKAILFNRGQFNENIHDTSVESIKFIGLAGDITVYSIPTMYGLFSKSLAEKDKEKECKCDDPTAAYEYVAIKADTETLMDLDDTESSTKSTNNTDPISNFKRIAKIILLDEIPVLEMISDMSNLMHAIKSVIMSSSDMTLDILKAHIAYRADMYKQGISDKVLVELAEFINRLYSDVDI